MDFCINEYETNVHKRKYKKTIDLLIGSNSQFTVVLMMKGGIDDKFFKVFKFSNWFHFFNLFLFFNKLYICKFSVKKEIQ
jgi:hypothetical protein